jgi:hypothetical protein
MRNNAWLSSSELLPSNPDDHTKCNFQPCMSRMKISHQLLRPAYRMQVLGQRLKDGNRWDLLGFKIAEWHLDPFLRIVFNRLLLWKHSRGEAGSGEVRAKTVSPDNVVV